MPITHVLSIVLILLTLMAQRSRAGVSADAENALKDVQAAYDNLHTMEISGTVTYLNEFVGRPALANKLPVTTSSFSGIYESPNRFRLEMPVLVPNGADWPPDVYGCSGTVLYSDVTNHTHRLAMDAPEEKPTLRDMVVESYVGIQSVRPMAFAVEENAFQMLQAARRPQGGIQISNELSLGDPITIDGKQFQAVIDETNMLGQKHTETLLIDPQTHLVRRTILEQQHGNLKTTQTLDIVKEAIDQPIDEARFKWTPPAEWFATTKQPATQPTTQTTTQPATQP
jgi:outer membrane lipoprotein-sorting protein